MTLNPRSHSSCRTSWTCTGRLFAALLVAALSLSGLALAAGEPQHGQIAPNGPGPKSDRPVETQATADDSGDGSLQGEAAAPAAAPAPSAPKSGTSDLDRGASAPTAGMMAVPGNDDCTGAIPIPAGPFPFRTAPVDITDASPFGAPGESGLCATTDNTIWYSFSPAVSGVYIFTTCAGRGATGSTVRDTVLAVFTSTGGACPAVTSLACNDTDGGCTTGAGFDQSTVSAVLTAGQTYFVEVGRYAGPGETPLAPGFTDVVVQVDLSPAPTNDNCSNATPLTLNRVTNGSTAGGTDDYQSTPTAACFSGVQQTLSTSPGLDVVYSFTAPAAGTYSFRGFTDSAAAGDGWRNQDATIYVASNCPASGAPTCIAAANRKNPGGAGSAQLQNRAEEVSCVPLTAGQTVYVFVDNATAGNVGFDFRLEPIVCTLEAEPNETTATASPLACTTEGSISPTTGDVDFFQLGVVPTGYKIFVMADAQAAYHNDLTMRITTSTDTLEFDNDDGASPIGSTAPVVAGTLGTGVATFARIRTNVGALTEPYHVFSVIEPPYLSAQLEDEGTTGNNGFGTANGITTGYVRGELDGSDASAGRGDIFRFCVNAGDQLQVFGDGDPTRDGTAFCTGPNIYDINGGILGTFGASACTSNLTPSPGTLAGVTPTIPGEGFMYRARYSGPYWIGIFSNSGFGDYAAAIAVNCQPFPVRTGDPQITMTGPSGTVTTTQTLVYTISITNPGPDTMQDVKLTDILPPELQFVGLSVSAEFGLSNVSCTSLPAPGASGPLVCTNYCLAPGSTTTYTLTVQVAGCIGSGVAFNQTATISTLSTDSNLDNNTATASLTSADDGTCSDGDACTTGDRCVGTVCTPTGPTDCDDHSVCTDDFCDSQVGCINDPGPGQQCNDGQPCTQDLCDPVTFCYFPPVSCDDGNPCTADSCDEQTGNCLHTPVAAGTACEDGNACTTGDTCDANALCVGGAPPNCDDGNVCTDDSCSPATGCVNAPVAGRSCDDANACTTADTCSATGACVGGPPPNCDDGNVCTADSCDTATGCVNTPTPGSACTDGNACTIADTCNSAGQCVSGAPVICGALDQCHDAGVCDPGTGLCSNPNKPDGTVCNDGNLCTTGDVCTSGVCVGDSHINEADPRTNGYYKRLCHGPHSGDQLTDADAACVAQVTATFAGISTVAQICDVIEPSQPNNDKCGQTEDDLMVLALNICRARVCTEQSIESQCGSNTNVAQSLAESDAILDSSSRNFDTCSHAKCLDEEINTGRSLELNTLILAMEAGNVRLNWNPPYLNDGSGVPKKYNVWRRQQGSLSPFTKIGDTPSPTFLDTTSGSGAWDYEITAVMN